MKRKPIFYSSVMLVVLIISALGVGIVSASTGCFTDTNGHWAEISICWMKDNNITSGVGGGLYDPNNYVTRAQMAVFMQKSAEVPPSVGDIYINTGANEWNANGTTDGYVKYYTNGAFLYAATAGDKYFQLTTDLPATLYGRQMYLSGAKLCIDPVGGANLTDVQLLHRLTDGTLYNFVEDTTVRTTAQCIVYTLPFTGSVYGGEIISLLITANFTNNTEYLVIRSATFILKPSNSSGVLVPGTLKEVSEKESMAIDSVPVFSGEGP